MKLGIMGAGIMGANIAQKLQDNGFSVSLYDINQTALNKAKKEQKIKNTYTDLGEFVLSLESPKVVWVMVPAGEATERAIQAVSVYLIKSDILIDGGNSKYTDAVKRALELAKKGIHFMDVGTSGGQHGYDRGYSLMVGGNKEIYKYLEPIFKTLAPKDGYGYMGKNGTGHFTKMIHNGIEYGMMQAICEGLALYLEEQAQNPDFGLSNIRETIRVYAHGSVIESWLVELMERAINSTEHEFEQLLEEIAAKVNESGEGRWTVEAGLRRKVPMPVISSAVNTRFFSTGNGDAILKLLSILRNQFGGHKMPKE